MPKLRPSVILPPMTMSSPIADMTAVIVSGISPGAWPARSSGGPTIDTVVAIAAALERSTIWARRRMTVSTTISDSLTSSSRPVMWPVRTKSARRLIDNMTNSPPTRARAARSRVASRDMTALSSLVQAGLRRVAVDEVRRAGAVDQLARDLRRDAAVAAERDHLIEQVARVAGAQRTAVGRVVAPLQI